MKTIIIYTTNHGSVEHAAQMLKPRIPGDVELINMMKKEAPLLDEFDNVILGGSIYAGKIQSKLSQYAEKHLPELLTKRIGLFICAAQKEEISEKELVDSFPKDLIEHAICKEVFGYEIHFEDMNFFEKMIVRFVMKQHQSYSELSSEKINGFAETIAER